MSGPEATVIAGGVERPGSLRDWSRVWPPETVTAVVNVADDTLVHGVPRQPRPGQLHLHPRRRQRHRSRCRASRVSWSAMEVLGRHAAASSVTQGDAAGWFNLGDRDLGTHLYRTSHGRGPDAVPGRRG
ncbi:MAG: hypothetical protein R2716_13370 [Microthrixaceae bacterium]